MPNKHAFATGITFDLKFYRLERLVLFLIKPFRLLFNFLRSLEIKQTFYRFSITGNDVKIGLDAWCFNQSTKDRIRIGNRSVCKGILRVENWANGYIDIGNDVYIGDGCIISSAEGITIGNSTLLAHGVQVFDNNTHPIDPETRVKDYKIIRGYQLDEENFFRHQHIKKEKIVIGEKVWIGFNAIIMRGIIIGAESIIASGSVVVNDVPPRTIVAGNPARVIRKI